jgi:hypothetical protein
MPAATTTKPGTEPYLPVEEVARRLDLPLGILLRRVEAGDVPSRREDGPDGVHFLVRLGDLGIEGVSEDIPAPIETPAIEQSRGLRARHGRSATAACAGRRTGCR